MNRFYRVIFNASLGVMQVVSELTLSHGRSSTKKSRLLLPISIVLMAMLSLTPTLTLAAVGDILTGAGNGGDNQNAANGLGGAGGVAGGGGGAGGNGIGGNGGAGATQSSAAQPGVKQDTGNPAGGIAGPVSDLSFGGGGGGSGGLVPPDTTAGYGGKGSISAAIQSSNATVLSGSSGGDSYSGGGGGGGGALVLTSANANFNNVVTGTITGGAGGSYIDYVAQDFANGGGGGGVGVALMGIGTISNAGSISGGAGGTVELSYGGNGGAGVFLVDGGTLTNSMGATVTGGNAGESIKNYHNGDAGAGVLSNRGNITNSGTIAGGTAPTTTGALSGTGGDGIRANGTSITNSVGATIEGGTGLFAAGNGVSLINNGAATLLNQGTIRGGESATASGVGVYVSSNNNLIINAKLIAGGTGGNAVELNGDSNTLELRNGYEFTGNVVSNGSNDTLQLGGNQNATFDVSQIGATGKYQSFENYRKTEITNAGIAWTLTGTTTELTPWTIHRGALVITDDAALGDTSGQLTIDAATLRTSGIVNSSRAITLNASNSTISTTDGTLTLNGNIAGAGALNKTGNGTLVLTNADNGYAGRTNINQGTLRAGATDLFDVSSGVVVARDAVLDLGGFDQTLHYLSGEGEVKLSDATLTSNATEDATFGGTLTGNGDLIKTGFHTLTLTGSNTYTGNTTVNQGSLILGANHALGTSSLTVAADAIANINGHSQNVSSLTNQGAVTLGPLGSLTSGTLTNTGNGYLDLEGGVLTLLNGGTSSATDGLRGTGTLNLSGGNLIVSASNAELNSQINIGDSTSLTLSNDGTLGTSAVTFDNGTLNLNRDFSNFGNTLSGDGTININADVTVTGANAGEGGFSGVYNLSGDSTLTVSSATALGTTSRVNLQSADDTLTLSGYKGEFTNVVAGEGLWRIADQADVILTEFDNIANSVAIDITNATLGLQNVASFAHALTGNGTLKVNNEDEPTQLTLTSTVGSEFQGILNLQNTLFALNADNVSALRQATLAVSSGTQIDVEDGNHQIGALGMNTGTLIFDNISDVSGVVTSQGTIAASTIDTEAGGTIKVALPATLAPSTEGIAPTMLDEGTYVLTLATGTTTGYGRNIQLTDMLGERIIDDETQGLRNPGSDDISAQGLFGYQIYTQESKDGLYVYYGLQELDLKLPDLQAFVLEASTLHIGVNSNDFSSLIKGVGDLALVSDAGSTLSLSHENNTYTGATWVRAGNLRLDANNALGQTRLLDLGSGTTTDLNATSQTVGKLDSASDSTLNFNDGTLTVTDGGQASGVLTGGGKLVLTAGTLDITNANNSFSAATEINGATAHLTQVSGLGTGAITNNGVLNLDGASGALVNALTGTTGQVTLTNNANVQLTANNSNYGGSFSTATDTTLTAVGPDSLGSAQVINNGTLVLDTATEWHLTNTISGEAGTLIKQGIGTVTISGDTVTANQTLINAGTLVLGDFASNAALANATFAIQATAEPTLASDVRISSSGTLAGEGSVTRNVINDGTFKMKNALTGNSFGTFTIGGNYTGTPGSSVQFGTVLAGDSSATDKLVILGSTLGQSNVIVNNIGGPGAQTVEGIKIIDVSGDSAGQFILANRVITAGAYDYQLLQGGVSTPSDGDWYLRSAAVAEDLRPESGSYGSNVNASNTLFTNIISDVLSNRLGDGSTAVGETLYVDEQTGEVKSTNLWLRMKGSHNRSQDESGMVKTQDNRYVTVLGSDVARWQTTAQDLWRLGVMVGYGNSNSTTVSQGTGYNAKGKVDGYTAGIYGGWFANARDNRGAYVDGSLHYSWFNNEVNGQELAPVSYNSKGFTASLGTGYAFPIGGSGTHDYFIQPQAQVTWMGVKADDVVESSGTRVSGVGNNNIQTRLGVKVYAYPTQAVTITGARFQPFVQTSWIRNSKEFGTDMDGTIVKQGGSKNLAEVKMGLEGLINKQLSVSGNLGLQTGGSGYYNTSLMLGVTYTF